MNRKIFGSLIAASVMALTVASCHNAPEVASPPPSASVTMPTQGPVWVPPTILPDPCKDVSQGMTTEDKDVTSAVTVGEITQVRMGHHECFDRVVIDLGVDQQVGFRVGYVPVVNHEGSGAPVEVDGAATLQVVVDAPLAGMAVGTVPMFNATPGWELLQEIKSAGSFEGQTALALGLSQKVAFDAYYFTSTDGVTHIVIDIMQP